MLVSLKEKIALKKLQRQRMADLLAAASHCPECWRRGGYKRHQAALNAETPHGLKGRTKVKRKPTQRITVRVSEQERAQGCTSCTLSRCREGSPCCNLTRITIAKRSRYIEQRKTHNAAD